jgi:hypothetical protein
VASARVSSISLHAGGPFESRRAGADGAYLAVFETQPHVRRVITYTDGSQLVIDPPRP